MSPGLRNLQLTPVAGGKKSSSAGSLEDAGDLEDVRLLDSYDEGDDSLVRIEGGTRRIHVRVTGMTCAACSNSVEEALRNLDGVFTASVALLQNMADVVFDPTLVKVGLLALLGRFCFDFVSLPICVLG